MERNTKNSYITALIGISIQEFRDYIESKFKYGMNWDNYGKNNIGMPVVLFHSFHFANQV